MRYGLQTKKDRLDYRQAQIDSAVKHGYRIHKWRDIVVALDTTNNSRPQAKVWYGTAANPRHNYFFSRGRTYAAAWLRGIMKSHVAKELYKQERLDKRKNFTVQIKPGDVLYYSWGYDQTNVSFFQVIDVNKKTVTFRKISYSTVPGSEYGDSDRVVPTIDSFHGPEIKKRILAPGDNVKIKDDWASVVCPKEEHYRSWGR